MKSLAVIPAILGVLSFCASCERHSWQETKALHDSHGKSPHQADQPEHGGGGHTEDAGEQGAERKTAPDNAAR
jgi:hypothetical protein